MLSSAYTGTVYDAGNMVIQDKRVYLMLPREGRTFRSTIRTSCFNLCCCSMLPSAAAVGVACRQWALDTESIHPICCAIDFWNVLQALSSKLA